MGIEALNCNSCGRDCSAVCGTRQFRSCCFNYIRKRSSEPSSRSLLRSNELRSAGSSSSSSGGPSLVSVASLTDADSLLNNNNNNRMNNPESNNIIRAVVGDQILSPNTPSSSTSSTTRRDLFYPETLDPSIRHQYLLLAEVLHRLARQQ